jgi:diguanylate cyclase (GGDEF)-like protein
VRAAHHADGSGVTIVHASLLALYAVAALTFATITLVRAVVGGARREVLFDGAILGLGVATVGTGFLVVPAGDESGAAFLAATLLALSGGALGCAFVCSTAVRRLSAAHVLLMIATVAAPGGPASIVALGVAAAVLVGVTVAAARSRVAHDPENDGAKDAVRRHLLAPVACMTVFPASLALLLVLRGPSTLEVALWGATWSVAGLLVFARQNWLLGDRHRAVARERDLRREMVRRNAELGALTDLADAMTRLRQEHELVERGLQVLRRAADARSVHIELAGEHHRLPEDAAAPRDDDPRALSLPLVVRDEQLGSVTLASYGAAFVDETRGLVGLLADQLAVGLSHVRDYNEKSHQALRDPLTGIYNRRVLQDALARELRRSARDGSEVALTLLDIDDFKAINDVHGHDAGDEVLRQVAACGRDVVRPQDTFARIGGEEFALLTPGAGAHEALLIAERLRVAVAGLDVLPDRGVTVSAGLAAWPVDAADGDALRRAADAALYRAKATGKNRCELAGEAPAPA